MLSYWITSRGYWFYFSNSRYDAINCCLIELNADSLDPATYRLVLCIFAKFFISTSFAGVYSYTSELFPTAARSAAVGVCSTFGRLGGILAPIIDSMVNEVFVLINCNKIHLNSFAGLGKEY